MDIIKSIEEDAAAVIAEVAEKAGLKKNQLFIIGCSSSETIGEHMDSSNHSTGQKKAKWNILQVGRN